MIGCPNEKTLQRFADGELKQRDEARVAGHVRSCELCANQLEQLHRLSQLVSGAIRKEAYNHNLSPLWENVLAGITPPAPQPSSWQLVLGLLWKPAAKVAYALLLVLLAGFFGIKSLLPEKEQFGIIGKAQVVSVSSFNPKVTVSVVVPFESNSAIVWVTGLDATKEN